MRFRDRANSLTLAHSLSLIVWQAFGTHILGLSPLGLAFRKCCGEASQEGHKVLQLIKAYVGLGGACFGCSLPLGIQTHARRPMAQFCYIMKTYTTVCLSVGV